MSPDASAVFGYIVIPVLVLIGGAAATLSGVDPALVVGGLIVYLLVMIGLDLRRAARALAVVPVLLSAPRPATPPTIPPAPAPAGAAPSGSAWPFRPGSRTSTP